VKPESVALGAFGIIAALVCLIVSVQALSRMLRQGNEDRRILQSLGASHWDTLTESLIGSFGCFAARRRTRRDRRGGALPGRPARPGATGISLSRHFVRRDRARSRGGHLLVVLGVSAVLIALANTPQRIRLAQSKGPRRSTTCDVFSSSDFHSHRQSARTSPSNHRGAVGRCPCAPFSWERPRGDAYDDDAHLLEWTPYSGFATSPLRLELEPHAESDEMPRRQFCCAT